MRVFGGHGSFDACTRPVRRRVADAQRPQADRDRDRARMPAEILAFAQIDPGEKVGDFIMGGGYWTRLLSNAVGPQGKVYAFQPDEFIAFRPAYGDEQNAAVTGRPNVVALRGPVAAPPFPEPLDTIITVQNMHDLYIGAMPQGTVPRRSRRCSPRSSPAARCWWSTTARCRRRSGRRQRRAPDGPAGGDRRADRRRLSRSRPRAISTAARRPAHRQRLRPGDSRKDRPVRSAAAQAGLMRRTGQIPRLIVLRSRFIAERIAQAARWLRFPQHS
jgi:hypothetical protein